MNVQKTIGQECIGKSGSFLAGFTLIMNSRDLADGHHSLLFIADYPGGASAATVVDVFIQNTLPYDVDRGGSD
jgi:hypothetical protein